MVFVIQKNIYRPFFDSVLDVNIISTGGSGMGGGAGAGNSHGSQVTCEKLIIVCHT